MRTPTPTTIREVRTLRHMSQGELARRAGLARTHVIRLEQHQNSPTLNTLSRIARALGVPVAMLLDRTDAFTQKPPNQMERNQ